jgi:transcriptional regulator with XRE-family HTH domain
MPNHFAKNFKKLRLNKGFTQQQLAAHLKISRPNIGSYEESRAEPSFDRLIQIADLFKISIDELLKTEL